VINNLLNVNTGYELGDVNKAKEYALKAYILVT